MHSVPHIINSQIHRPLHRVVHFFSFDFRRVEANMILQLWQICFAAFGFGSLVICIYRVKFSSLSKLPGPWHSLFTDVYLIYTEFTGQRREYIHELHRKFGPVVRLGPNEASFTALEALKEIYQSGGSEYNKTEFYTLFKQFGTRLVSTKWSSAMFQNS